MSQKSNATAVIIAAPKGQNVTLINCKDQQCSWPPQEAPVVTAERQKTSFSISGEQCHSCHHCSSQRARHDSHQLQPPRVYLVLDNSRHHDWLPSSGLPPQEAPVVIAEKRKSFFSSHRTAMPRLLSLQLLEGKTLPSSTAKTKSALGRCQMKSI